MDCGLSVRALRHYEETKKRLKIEASLYTILQILSVTIFERMPLLQVLTDGDYKDDSGQNTNQLILFN